MSLPSEMSQEPNPQAENLPASPLSSQSSSQLPEPLANEAQVTQTTNPPLNLPSEQLQASLAAASRYLEQVNNIGLSDDVQDLNYLIDFLVFIVDQAYPFIPCPSGCSNCCVDSGLPRTSALEWAHIHGYLSQMPPEILKQVIEQNERRHRPQYQQFLAEQARIENPDTDLALPKFECKECPFLIEGRCSVYAVRPTICRGFGYFTWRPGKERDSQIFACQMAADTLLDGLRQIHSPYAALPAWNPISDKVYTLNRAQSTGVMATLPLWLMAHTDANGQILPLNLNPDFSQSG